MSILQITYLVREWGSPVQLVRVKLSLHVQDWLLDRSLLRVF